ncbi:dihydrodipicolinate synthase [Desulfonispora thiosulfatigenes DSM 11270]|uniref:4-hydroxy-tetrahydrodipicolinate synthase n=1 Tax=Desulfonispora thiosulfatigenes DSM 11270 TaxID=656914 RepID=A0A1W1VNA3_DESTI|nr:4-hydroxy-tetrahydrodipicolinate synthase [Desulfonispora thiosulfatigenes]SMB94541.1 dihydrodipicolinate synthase [Desulfonispora thiosulfatigenes DSM 11270]
MLVFGSVLTAMITPFDENLEVDYTKASELAVSLIENGSDGVVVAGTTGESPTLSFEEKVKLFEAVKKAVGNKGQVIAGTGSNSTRDSILLTEAAEKAGVDGVMLVAPYYNKPPQSALYKHFEAIANKTKLPILLYNVPGRSSVNMSPELIASLAKMQNIVAIKEASGSMDQASEIKRLVSSDFLIYSGDDSLTLPLIALGGHGVVSVASHVAGTQIKEMIASFKGGNVQKAQELHVKLFPLFKAMFITTNPIPVKAAVNLMGKNVGSLRLPLEDASDEHKDLISLEMNKLGIL